MVQVFDDIAVAIRLAQEVYHLECILVVDLDAHQGNGTNSSFQGDPRVLTCDLYCNINYAWSNRTCATYNHALPSCTTDEEYLQVLKSCLAGLSDF